MTQDLPTPFNMAGYFLDDRIREGRASRTALRTPDGPWTYGQVQDQANRWAHVLTAAGIAAEQRVVISLPDVPAFATCLFGILKAGAVVVMVNPYLPEDQLEAILRYVEPAALIADMAREKAFREAAGKLPRTPRIMFPGSDDVEAALNSANPVFENVATHPADPAMWLFSGGTTGLPKGVVQSHTSFVNTTERYAKGVLGLTEDDITLSVPKLYFGYATGSNLLFPFSVGASAVLFPERCTADAIFDNIRAHDPTVLINVPTMVNHMVSHPEAEQQDLSCLRLATSAGEALPLELHQRWDTLFGVELLDGLGTAEMWHVFLTNRPGEAKRGTLGQVVPGFEIQLCDDAGTPVSTGEVGRMRVRGDSRAIKYWRNPEQSRTAFVGEWYVSGDMMSQDNEGFFTYQGRADDLMKVSGKWLSPREVENCLLEHDSVSEAAVIGVETSEGLIKPAAFIVLDDVDASPELATLLQDHVKTTLEPYKYPRVVTFLPDLPRTHLGKVDRGALRRSQAV